MNSASMGRALNEFFQRKHLIIVPETYWTGYECDLLIVTPEMRIIDVEIKISRADFRKDYSKDKWFHHWDYDIDGEWNNRSQDLRRRRELPQRVWKHYFAIPKELWKPEMVDELPSKSCGVILLSELGSKVFCECARKATPDKNAEKIGPEAAIDLGRLASLRMWDALNNVHRMRKEHLEEISRLKGQS